MSTQKTRMSLAEGQEKAAALVELLAPYCERIEIAGSIRRQQDTVGDVEIVCEPKYEPVRVNLIDDEVVNRVHWELVEMAMQKQITPRLKKTGHRIAWLPERGEPRFVAAWWEGVAVDVFLVNADRLDWWGWTLFLRTGPGDANRQMVTRERSGGLLPERVRVEKGKVYARYRDRFQEKPTPDEKAVFQLWEMAYVEPENRDLKAYVAAKRKFMRLVC
jgi:DNA polymerase/3'-5' exonuclease PolX